MKFILIYFYGPTPNQFFVNRTPEKTELLDDISLHMKIMKIDEK